MGRPRNHPPPTPGPPALCPYCAHPTPHGHPTCGMHRCVRLHDATAEWWRGRARMAAARTAAGVPLDELDLQAIARHPMKETTP